MKRPVQLIPSLFAAIGLVACLTVACSADEFTLEIFGRKEAVGAQVFVDGKIAGTMKEFGSDGAHLALGLPKGTLVIEVQKEGYESYKEVVAVRADESEHFVSVTLPPKNKGK